MRVELVEKTAIALAILAITVAAGFVVTFSVVSKESGISREEVDATIAVDDWLENVRATANGQQLHTTGFPIPPPNASASAAAGAQSTPGNAGAPGRPSAPEVSANQPPGRDNYFESSNNVPPNERADPNVPWLRRQEGVAYVPHRTVPGILQQKLQSFDDAWDMAQQGGGEFVGGRYRINWIQPDSYLATKLGLEPGDEVMSVNGLPVGNGFSASRAMYDQLKGERHFAVKVLRGGAPVVLSFSVN